MKTSKNPLFVSLVLGLAIVAGSAQAQSQTTNVDHTEFSKSAKTSNHSQIFSSYSAGERVVIRSSQSGTCVAAWWRNTPCSGHTESEWVVAGSGSVVQFRNPRTQSCLGMNPQARLMMGGMSCSSPMTRWQLVGESGRSFDESRFLLTFSKGLCASDNEKLSSTYATACGMKPNQVYRIFRAN